MGEASVSKPFSYAWKHAKLAHKKPKSPQGDDLLVSADVIPMQNDIDFAYAAIYDNHIIISFKETDAKIESWLSNFDMYPLKKDEYLKTHLIDGEWGKGMIHDGFYTAWKFFKSCIDKIIESYGVVPGKFMIICCGYSRGGALAELCSRHLAKNKEIPNSCFTFGGPRVGNQEYRDQFRMLPINGTRVVNGWDIVPGLPPKSFGFRHGCANLIWNKKAWWKKFIPYIKITDHISENYDKFIEKFTK